MAAVRLASLADAREMGRWLGENLAGYGNPPLLMTGELGAGKTALARFIVEAMPGAENAEVASPSFTICNRYPVEPETLHCDLYRCKSAVPDELLEEMERGECQIIIEWAEYFPRRLLPPDVVDIRFNFDNNARLLDFAANGPEGARLLRDLPFLRQPPSARRS